MDKEIFELLRNSNLCKGLNDEQVKRLVDSNLIKRRNYKRNEILFWTEKTPESLVMLISGSIAMGRDTFQGRRSLSKSNTVPGALLNEVRLFSPEKLLWEYALALEDSEVLEVSCSLLLESTADYSDIQIIIMRNLMEAFVEKINRLGDKVRILSFPSVRDRIAFYLFQIQDNNQRVVLTKTREDIADYLGIARPSLSRELGRMQEEGLIQLDGHEVIVLNQMLFDCLFD